MSWGVTVLGRDRAKVKAKVRKALERFKDYSPCWEKVAEAVDCAVDCFPAGDFVLLVEANGHTDNGGGNFHLNIRSFGPTVLVDA